MDGTVTWRDADYAEVVVESLVATIQMSRQLTRSVLAVSDATPRYNSMVKFKIRSRQLTPEGWAANAYGRATLRYRWDIRKTCRVRSVTLPTVNSAASPWDVVRIVVG